MADPILRTSPPRITIQNTLFSRHFTTFHYISPQRGFIYLLFSSVFSVSSVVNSYAFDVADVHAVMQIDQLEHFFQGCIGQCGVASTDRQLLVAQSAGKVRRALARGHVARL